MAKVSMILLLEEKEIHLSTDEKTALCGKQLPASGIIVKDARAQKNVHQDCIKIALDMVQAGQLKLVVN